MCHEDKRLARTEFLIIKRHSSIEHLDKHDTVKGTECLIGVGSYPGSLSLIEISSNIYARKMKFTPF